MPGARGQSSVLSSGIWYKFSVNDNGIYKIDYDLLRKAGINPSQINPKNIRIYTGQPGMLPQANSAKRVIDLKEVAISVAGEEDGKFDSNDYILLYAQGPDILEFDTKKNFFRYENNIYTDNNFYYLTVSTSEGKRLAQSQNLSGNYPVISQFDDFAYYETDKYNLLHSGRQWFGEQFDQSLSLTIQFNLPGIVPNSSIKLTSHVMAQSITNCSFNVSFNNQALITQQVPAIPNSAFTVKGSLVADTITFSESSASASSQNAQQVRYQFTKGGPGISIGYLDYFIFGVKRKLALYNDQTLFVSSESLNNPNSTFQINLVTTNNQVWEVTNAFNAKNQLVQLTGSTFTFSAKTDSLRKFVVFDPAKIAKPKFESTVTNQDLHAISSADMLIISHPSFLTQAKRLEAHRQTHDLLNVVTVSTDQVFNEYGGGKPDITAMRDFIRDVYKKSSGQLKYVLLFGRGSYDYKDRVFENTNLVPIYEAYSSLEPLLTYSSDDYLGFLEDNEGAWPESPVVNYTMDIAVGRLPAKKAADAQNIVDKLIEYDTNPERFGPWRKELLFVADDGDFDLHIDSANQLASSIDQTHPEVNVNKLFLDYYKQVIKPNGQFSPEATKALDLSVREGKVIVNYTGHGSEQVWAQEQILNPDVVQSLNNGPMYPLFVTATCEFGRNDDPFIISSAENLLLKKKGGAIGLVTTARPVYSNTNSILNIAFYQSLFARKDNAFRSLGDVVRDTKNNSLSGVYNRNFSLLGDPSMKLALANNIAFTSSVKTSANSDTLKALSRVSIKGEIQDSNGSKLNNFNGTVFATVFDKAKSELTLGDPHESVNPPSPVYSFVDRPNKVFQGSVSATQGAFQFDFIMPSSLLPTAKAGKLSLYAFNETGTEAIGTSSVFKVGGQEPNPPADTTPPEIKLYISDTTFIDGGTVGPNTKLVARLFDASGINMASVDPQKSIIATLDNKWSYVVNDYYYSDKNDFKKGTVIFPLDTLKKGAHVLSLTASDTYNNTSTTSVSFVVTDGIGITVGDFINYPNPFNSISEETTFQFTHTRAGEDLGAAISIYDLTGRPVVTINYSVVSSNYQVDLGRWNGETASGIKIGPGVYVARLSVRSLADGSQSNRSIKLIILN
ncbi:peptidase C25 [Cytophagales bacterium WSM2-2]|nr:peptidase C25 [Cytophagales bacterium WSM2-2]